MLQHRETMKTYFLIIDTETTIDERVADFGAIVVDHKGNVVERFACMVFETWGKTDLFYDKTRTGMWARSGLNRRVEKYESLIMSGDRAIVSRHGINRRMKHWLEKYNPTMTAYNLDFDFAKCQNTGIDLGIFPNKFCLWKAAVGNICKTKKYLQFVLENHLINNRTEKGNMSVSTTAESVCGFVTGNLVDEPHTAIEDAEYFELPILKHILKIKGWQDKIVSHNWREFQVRDLFKAK